MKNLVPAMIAAGVIMVSGMPASAFVERQCVMGYGVVVCGPRVTAPSARIIALEQCGRDHVANDRCRLIVDPSGNPTVKPSRVIDLDEPELAEYRAWETRCKPRLVRDDATGVKRWLYEEKGCEWGP